MSHRPRWSRTIISAMGVFVFCATSLAMFLAGPVSIGQDLAQVSPTGREDKLAAVSQHDRTSIRLVQTILKRDHLVSRPIDDAIAARAMDQYLRSLDPLKVYFLKSDVDEFKASLPNLPSEISRGQIPTALNIFRRFVQRVGEGSALAHEWLDVEHDFTVDESIITDRDAYDYAANVEELRERWRKRVKYSLLLEENAEGIKLSPVERLKRRYSMYHKRMEQMDSEDVVEMFLTAVTTSFDPHTSYMSKRTFENFMIQMRLALEGIGATLSSNDDGYTEIRRIVPNGAAFKQGDLAVGDRIVAVGQAPGTEMIDVVGMKLDEVVAKIRGKAGTLVRLSVLKEGVDEIRNIEIVREKITLEDEAAVGKVFEEGTKADGSPFRVGVIRLPSFYADMESRSANRRSTTTDVKKILEDFNRQNVDALLLDLSQNGGGSLTEAVDCTGLFIESGPVVQIKDPDGQIRKLNDYSGKMVWSKPLVVLTSKFSASASEILAGAVQDYQRGLVVGDSTTHGKGTVQSLQDLNEVIYGRENPQKYLGALKITMQQFYRPDGDSTQKRGVLSDIVLPSLTDNLDNILEADLDYAIEFDRVPSAPHSMMGLVTPHVIDSITNKSRQRISESDFFQKEIRRIEKYVELKNDKTVPLNRDAFQARRKDLDKEKEDEKVIEDRLTNSSRDIERKPYLDEVIKITADYARALGAG
ncbi:MAG: carboxy terminal-processing peptidase [Pirellulaceae bacterium]|nr:carboxy terminal-processing peptidase [Pirellulaceae bacterium]